jgi:hypothetical protein
MTFEIPGSNIQAPERVPTIKISKQHDAIWRLKLGVSLDVGVWDLELAHLFWA